jgi:hypothetical protein
MQRNLEPMQRQVESWRQTQITDAQAKLILYNSKPQPNWASSFLSCRPKPAGCPFVMQLSLWGSLCSGEGT